MFPIRVERFGRTYRLIQFKNMNMGQKRIKQPYIHSLAEDEGEYWERRWSEQDGRFRSSVARSRARVRELALCNDFEYFCTFTLSPEKQDRHDLKKWVKDFGNWVGNYNKKYNCKLEYVIIPEQHKNGAWHAHGLVRGIAPASLVKNEHGYFDIPYYSQRFGFMNLSVIKDRERIASYVTKYITKDLHATCHALGQGAHMFYSSRGLKSKEVLWSGFGDFKADTENAFCKIAFVDFSHAMEVIGRSLLALRKSPYETTKQLVTRILMLERSYENKFEGNGKVCNDSEGIPRTSDPCLRGGARRIFRGARNGRAWNGRVHAPYNSDSDIRKDDEMLKEVSGSLFHVEQITQEKANELTNAAYNEYNERSRRNHEQLCFATSQGISDTYFDFTNPANHWQTRFTSGAG